MGLIYYKVSGQLRGILEADLSNFITNLGLSSNAADSVPDNKITSIITLPKWLRINSLLSRIPSKEERSSKVIFHFF